MYYGMFSEEGNLAVHGIVLYHKAIESPWSVVYQNLCDLAKSDPTKFGEATDTMVREMVYDACQFTSDFYI
jgi:predicted homoserine dehydrogenase-like protein